MHDKKYLEEVIYKINEKNSFFLLAKGWSSPTYGFSYDKSRSTKAISNPKMDLTSFGPFIGMRSGRSPKKGNSKWALQTLLGQLLFAKDSKLIVRF
jgi:hypothetical protein